MMNDDERRRVNEILQCADSDDLPGVPDAGKVRADDNGNRAPLKAVASRLVA